MAFENLLKQAKRLALALARKEIERILARAEATLGVEAEATDEGVVLTGNNLKSRAVNDPQVRDVAR